MILNKIGEEFLYNGVMYRIGDTVVANESCNYAGLLGSICEIRVENDKDTENETPDIYCSFDTPVLADDVERLERTFSDLYGKKKTLKDISLDMVIVAPEMLIVPGRAEKTMKVYILTEDWAVDDGSRGSSSRVFSDILEAKAHLNKSLSDEITAGCIRDWIDDPEYMTDTSKLSYEGWIDHRYCENHYHIFIEEKEMILSPFVIGNIGREYMRDCAYEDFVSQVFEWDEVGQLSNEDYQKFISDKRIPQMISKNLSDTFWECYWESVSEVGNTLLEEYLSKKQSALD